MKGSNKVSLLPLVFFYKVRTCFVSDLQRGLKIQAAKFNIDGSAEVGGQWNLSWSFEVDVAILAFKTMLVFLFLASSATSRCGLSFRRRKDSPCSWPHQVRNTVVKRLSLGGHCFDSESTSIFIKLNCNEALAFWKHFLLPKELTTEDEPADQRGGGKQKWKMNAWWRDRFKWSEWDCCLPFGTAWCMRCVTEEAVMLCCQQEVCSYFQPCC